MEERSPVPIVAIAGIALVVLIGLGLVASRGSEPDPLVGQPWHLAAITGETPAFQGVIPPAEQYRYAIEFADDGTFSARADCNVLLGTFTVEGSDGITMTPGPSTLVACPDGSYGSLFAHALSAVTTWSLEEYELTLTTADGGTGTFVIGPSIVPPTTAPTLVADAKPDADPDTVSDPDPVADAIADAVPDPVADT